MAGNGPTLRAYQASDLERLKRIHAKQGFSYELPDLSDPIFPVGCVAEENGEPQMAAFLKIHAEAYLLADPDYGTPRDRWRMLLAVHESVRWQARELGLDSVTCWIPPSLTKKTNTGQDSAFVRRLRKLGWGRDEWEAFSFRVR